MTTIITKSECFRQNDLLEKANIVGTAKIVPVLQNYKLKAYFIDINEKYSEDDKKEEISIIQSIMDEMLYSDKHSGIGVVITYPSCYYDFNRFYRVNMWEEDELKEIDLFYFMPRKRIYKNAPSNSLWATKPNSKLIDFPDQSNNLNTLELPILAEEGKLWNKVILGEKSINNYMDEFVDVELK